MIITFNSSGYLLYKKLFHFDIINQKILEKISEQAEKINIEFYKNNKMIMTVYTFTFLIFIDIESLLLVIYIFNFKTTDSNNNQKWIKILIPLILEWFVTLGFLLCFKIRERRFNKSIISLVKKKQKKIKIYNEQNIRNFIKNLKLQIGQMKNKKFEKITTSILLIFCPFLLKILLFQKMGYKGTFTLSSALFYCYILMSSIIKIVVKCYKRFQLKKMLDSIPPIRNINNNTQSSETLNNNEIELCEKNVELRNPFSETVLNITFFIGKVLLGILFIAYFLNIGEKLDNEIGSCSWIVLFIPCYICILPILLYYVLHILSLYSVFGSYIIIPILTLFPTVFGFAINFVILPLKLENRTSVNPYIIPAFFIIATIFLGVHLLVLRKFKKR